MYSVEIQNGNSTVEVDVASIETRDGTRQVDNILHVIDLMNELGGKGWEIGEPRGVGSMALVPKVDRGISVGSQHGTIESATYYSMKRQRESGRDDESSPALT